MMCLCVEGRLSSDERTANDWRWKGGEEGGRRGEKGRGGEGRSYKRTEEKRREEILKDERREKKERIRQGTERWTKRGKKKVEKR